MSVAENVTDTFLFLTGTLQIKNIMLMNGMDITYSVRGEGGTYSGVNARQWAKRSLHDDFL